MLLPNGTRCTLHLSMFHWHMLLKFSVFFLNSVLPKLFCFACARCYVLPNIDNHQNDIKYISYRCVHAKTYLYSFSMTYLVTYIWLRPARITVFIIIVDTSYFYKIFFDIEIINGSVNLILIFYILQKVWQMQIKTHFWNNGKGISRDKSGILY